jgi:hypothetical protein
VLTDLAVDHVEDPLDASWDSIDDIGDIVGMHLELKLFENLF